LVAFIGLFSDKIDNQSNESSSPYIGNDISMFHASGIISIVSASIFAQLISFGVPEIITPLRHQRDSRRLLIFGLIGVATCYIFVGLSCSLYFGAMTKSPINLNFNDYRGGVNLDQAVPVWAKIISYFVALFPAMDVMSMFPLIAIALGNTIHARLLRFEWFTRFKARRLLVFSRLLSSLLPILASLGVSDLSQIIGYATIPGVWVAFFSPALLQYFSIIKCENGGIEWSTPYSNKYFSGKISIVVMLVLGVAVYGLVLYSLIVPS